MIPCFPDVQLFIKALFSLCISDSLWFDVGVAEFLGSCDPCHMGQADLAEGMVNTTLSMECKGLEQGELVSFQTSIWMKTLQ